MHPVGIRLTNQLANTNSVQVASVVRHLIKGCRRVFLSCDFTQALDEFRIGSRTKCHGLKLFRAKK